MQADEWVDTVDAQHTWTANRTCIAVFGFAIRSPQFYPCDPPFPCNDSYRSFHGGRLELLSLHPVRGRDLINKPDTVNQELCLQHRGYLTINKEGRIAPVVFSVPNHTDPVYELGRAYASVGRFVLRTAEPRPEGDLLNLCPPGRLCAVVALQLPEWYEACFYSGRPICCTFPI